MTFLMRYYPVAILSTIFLLIAFVCSHQPTAADILCPSGYWAATVNTSGGPYGSQRTFRLTQHPGMSNPICKFCPNVGCYITRVPIEEDPLKAAAKQTSDGVTTDTHLHTTHSTESLDSPNNLTTNGTSDGGKKEEGEQKKNYTLCMSCDPWNSLPRSENIVSYLDCVMIGEADKFYLFIYEPRFLDQSLEPVDCVDADFLAWIKNGTNLLGLELGFRMRTIPPFLFRYHQRIMQHTEYICIDGSSLANKSIPFEDTERFSSNKLTQVVFRTSSLQRDRRPPKAPDSQYTTPYQSEEEIAACPHIVLHKPANITPTTDCQFSPSVLPTTSDKVDRAKALERCSCRKINKNKKKKPIKPVNEGEFISEVNYAKILSACLLILVLLLTVGIIVAFCVLNADSLNLCKTRARKRREREAALMSELAEKAAKEAAAAAAEAERQPMAWHPIYGRYGMVPPTMGGAFGMFAPRTMDIPANQAVV